MYDRYAYLAKHVQSIDGARDTYIGPEELAYPHGRQVRPSMAVFADGKVRRAWAGIPDTFFSVPAHAVVDGRYVSGFLMVEAGVVTFTPNKTQGRSIA